MNTVNFEKIQHSMYLNPDFLTFSHLLNVSILPLKYIQGMIEAEVKTEKKSPSGQATGLMTDPDPPHKKGNHPFKFTDNHSQIEICR